MNASQRCVPWTYCLSIKTLRIDANVGRTTGRISTHQKLHTTACPVLVRRQVQFSFGGMYT